MFLRMPVKETVLLQMLPYHRPQLNYHKVLGASLPGTLIEISYQYQYAIILSIQKCKATINNCPKTNLLLFYSRHS